MYHNLTDMGDASPYLTHALELWVSFLYDFEQINAAFFVLLDIVKLIVL